MNNKVKVSENAYGETIGSLNYWNNHRNNLGDLYHSERLFLEPTLKDVESVLDIGCAAGGSYNFCKEAKFLVKEKIGFHKCGTIEMQIHNGDTFILKTLSLV